MEYLKGVGPLKADLLKKELGIFTFKDLLEFYPFRHIDKTSIEKIAAINPATDFAQVAGRLISLNIIGEKSARRLVAHLQDDSGEIELAWFQGISWVEKMLESGKPYLVFGKASFFNGKVQMVHPEIEPYTPEKRGGKKFLEPIYSSTEKLKARGLNGRALGKLTFSLLQQLSAKDLPENLTAAILTEYRFAQRWDAYCNIHFPASETQHLHAVRRLKFEEFFFAQLRLGLLRSTRHRFSKGWVFDKVGALFNSFYSSYLPFSLTNAQKRVLKEIRKDAGTGKQMNRLLQGDVGSGKTIVALLSMLIAADNGFQSVLMAPTEILATQHYNGIAELVKNMPVQVALLTGSSSAKKRKKILHDAESGILTILVGTHAVIEDKVIFNNLGFAVIDEQHKFGVAQRARLWNKNTLPPHVLVMTATPIPRTLALTAYGDLDYSLIDELPPGRQPITTVHRFENKRPQVMDFIKEELGKGRQAYVVYPLIEESSTLDYENLMKGFEEVKSFFPEPKYWISMVHGRQKADQTQTNMDRFISGDTQIMVSTTVIEVGVNVPNASVMVIESAEKFGLSQLHQLRGRVGRGSEQSFCILLTGNKISSEGRERLKILCETNDGFRVAEKDLEIRGPGDIEGTKQSGVLNFKLANIVTDRAMLEVSKELASRIVDQDPDLLLPENLPLKNFLLSQKGKTPWSKIS
ncbi:MAG: ATP-dependent DNA helicase RecG [Ferruginibacter sp.]|nr:ATP-dependent DNA helicase RecG [Ferruginibacter sp.]